MNERSVALHRKVFFDEVKERLIIITVNVTYSQGLNAPTNPMIVPNDVNLFTFTILEPECNKMTSMVLSLDSCFTEKQLASLNKRDLTRLK